MATVKTKKPAKKAAHFPEAREWLKLARAWDKPSAGRQFYKGWIGAVVNGNWSSGLCSSVSYAMVLPKRLRQKMAARISVLTDGGISFLFPHTVAGARKRADLCRQFAKEADAEMKRRKK